MAYETPQIAILEVQAVEVQAVKIAASSINAEAEVPLQDHYKYARINTRAREPPVTRVPAVV